MNRLAVAVPLGALALLGTGTAYAHGFGERYDLPIPLSFFMAGAAAAVAFSFVVIGLFVQRHPGELSYPRYNLLVRPRLGAALASRLWLTPVRVLSVVLLALVLVTALFGTNKPIENLSPTFVWIIWWVGMGYVAALLGNLWAVVNPWKITFEWGERLLGEGGDGRDGMFAYPERWSGWPAVVLFLVFAWLENVYTGASTPSKLGLLILAYSVVTWGGMAAFGKHRWLSHGEAFWVLFGLFSRFSPTEVRVPDTRVCRGCELECEPTGGGCVDCYACFERAGIEGRERELNLRPYAVGLARPGDVSTATAVFVLLTLSTVAFDGLTATSVWLDFQNAIYPTATWLGADTAGAISTMGLVLLPVVLLSVYLAFSWAIQRLSGEESGVPAVARAFVFSLVPIALAYNMAHFISLLAIQGQYIIPLASDPFGVGWDLLGTAGYRVNIALVNAKFVWFVAVVAIVLGHIASVYIAHVISMGRVADRSRALRGQYPMLLLMVFYTATSLWIIAQPIVS